MQPDFRETISKLRLLDPSGVLGARLRGVLLDVLASDSPQLRPDRVQCSIKLSKSCKRAPSNGIVLFHLVLCIESVDEVVQESFQVVLDAKSARMLNL